MARQLVFQQSRPETYNVIKPAVPNPSRRVSRHSVVAAVATATALGGCSTLENMLSGDKVDYRSTSVKSAKGLEVPPDLTQLARDTRYQTQGGVVSAATGASAPVPGSAAAAAASAPTVAVNAEGGLRVERAGPQRWLVVPMAPEQLWPQLRAFWEQRGFTLAIDNAQTGVMETNWSENRAKLPDDAVRNTIGRLLGNLFDTGERDAYRTRVERSTNGNQVTSEVYITHRGAQEVYLSEARREDGTTWRARANDPQLEAEFLTRLMVQLGAREAPARTAVAAAGLPTATTPGSAPAAAVAGGRAGGAVATTGATSLVVEEGFDRAWRRVGLALDRGGFTVEDRDRTAGLYYVRYVDPKFAGKDEPNFFMKWFTTNNPQAALRYRIALKTADNKTTVAVQNSTGAPEIGDNAQRIVALLSNELR